MNGDIGPSYQLVADDIRSRISSGEYQIGAPIPSTARLMKSYGVSSTVVRHAVTLLKTDGILTGHSGKAVFVRATPADSDRERHDAAALQRQVSALREEVHGLLAEVESLRSADVRAALVRLELNLADLYGKLGFDYPREDAADDVASGAVARGRRA